MKRRVIPPASFRERFTGNDAPRLCNGIVPSRRLQTYIPSNHAPSALHLLLAINNLRVATINSHARACYSNAR
jgi:hypothetical protein